MKADRIFETVLYADDLNAAKSFYSDVLGLSLYRESEYFLVYRLDSSALLIFDPKLSAEVGRPVPSHGAKGQGHIAFAASDNRIEAWRKYFLSKGIPIDEVVKWSEGGKSVYVRDPAGNSIEFAPSTLWGGNWDF